MEIAGWMTVAATAVVTLTTVGALDFMDRFVRRGPIESIAESITYLSAKSPDFYNNGSPLDNIVAGREINWQGT